MNQVRDVSCRSRSVAAALGLTLLVFTTPLSGQGTDAPFPDASSLEYELLISGKRVGRFTVHSSSELVEGRALQRVSVSSSIRLRRWFIVVFELSSEETTLVDEHGLRKVESLTVIDGDSIRLRGKREGNRLSFGVASNEPKSGKTLQFERGEFDTTSVEDLHPWLPAEGQTRTVRILDLDRLEIVERRLTSTRRERVEAAGFLLDCDVFSFRDRYANGEQWFARGHTPFFVQEKATDEDGPYEIRLKTVSSNPDRMNP